MEGSQCDQRQDTSKQNGEPARGKRVHDCDTETGREMFPKSVAPAAELPPPPLPHVADT
jgi:hypothetical protein